MRNLANANSFPEAKVALPKDPLQEQKKQCLTSTLILEPKQKQNRQSANLAKNYVFKVPAKKEILPSRVRKNNGAKINDF